MTRTSGPRNHSLSQWLADRNAFNDTATKSWGSIWGHMLCSPWRAWLFLLSLDTWLLQTKLSQKNLCLEREDKVVIEKWELLGKEHLIELQKHFTERLPRRKIDAC